MPAGDCLAVSRCNQSIHMVGIVFAVARAEKSKLYGYPGGEEMADGDGSGSGAGNFVWAIALIIIVAIIAVVVMSGGFLRGGDKDIDVEIKAPTR